MITRASPGGRRAAVHRMVRRFVWFCACVAWACGTATEPTGDEVASLAITPSAATITVGAQLSLRASIQDPDGRTVTGEPIHWSVRDPGVASVSTDGVVTGLAIGSTEVAASAGGKSAIAVVVVQRVPVAAVVVQPRTAELTTGARVQLTATARDANDTPLTDRTIVWSSSSDAVASVNGVTGMVTAVAPGVVTITATSEGKSDAATVTVSLVPVATVEVAPDPLALSVGQSTQLLSIARDASGSVLMGRATTWTSSNTAVATVSQEGVVQALSPGVSTITAAVEGRTGSSTLTVSSVPVGSVSVAPGSSTLLPRESVQLTATVRDANGGLATDRPVFWSSSNTAVATVTQSGQVVAVAAGSATIMAVSEGRADSAAITVIPAPVASIEVDPPAASVVARQTIALSVTLKDADGYVLTGRQVTFTSANGAIATVSAGGIVTGVAPGSTTIVVTAEGRSMSVPVTVTAVGVASVVIQPTTASITVGQSTTLSATVTDATGSVVTDRPVVWTTSNAAVATVSGTGVIAGVGPGTATITATSEGRSGTASVTVVLPPVATVTVDPPTATVRVLGTVTLTATAKDAAGATITGRTMTWSSSNPLVAIVSQSGVVTGLLPGTATITASTGGMSGTSIITVTAGPVASIRISPDTATIRVGAAVTFTAQAFDAAGNPVVAPFTISWTSSESSIASITSAGVATGKKAGTVTITATGGGRSDTATLTVTK